MLMANMAVSTKKGICKKCNQPFKNPNPSAKKRRAHKRICGTSEANTDRSDQENFKTPGNLETSSEGDLQLTNAPEDIEINHATDSMIGSSLASAEGAFNYEGTVALTSEIFQDDPSDTAAIGNILSSVQDDTIGTAEVTSEFVRDEAAPSETAEIKSSSSAEPNVHGRGIQATNPDSNSFSNEIGEGTSKFEGTGEVTSEAIPSDGVHISSLVESQISGGNAAGLDIVPVDSGSRVTTIYGNLRSNLTLTSLLQHVNANWGSANWGSSAILPNWLRNLRASMNQRSDLSAPLLHRTSNWGSSISNWLHNSSASSQINRRSDLSAPLLLHRNDSWGSSMTNWLYNSSATSQIIRRSDLSAPLLLPWNESGEDDEGIMVYCLFTYIELTSIVAHYYGFHLIVMTCLVILITRFWATNDRRTVETREGFVEVISNVINTLLLLVSLMTYILHAINHSPMESLENAGWALWFMEVLTYLFHCLMELFSAH